MCLSNCCLRFSENVKKWEKNQTNIFSQVLKEHFRNFKTVYEWKNTIWCICIQNVNLISRKWSSFAIVKVKNDLGMCVLFEPFECVLGSFFALLTKTGMKTWITSPKPKILSLTFWPRDHVKSTHWKFRMVGTYRGPDTIHLYFFFSIWNVLSGDKTKRTNS